jgi:HAD superfamily hydrolase (TIGR01493 family)
MIIAFDIFGTVFDLAGVPRQEIKDYAHHLRKPEWSPLVLPKSWETLPAFPDSREGIARLREKYFVVTCTNCPLGLQAKLAKRNGIQWDCMTPLELNRVFKTNPKAYMTICEVYGVEPRDVIMVTANEKFGDLEASRALGMQAILIRNPENIIDLAGRLGC